MAVGLVRRLWLPTPGADGDRAADNSMGSQDLKRRSAPMRAMHTLRQPRREAAASELCQFGRRVSAVPSGALSILPNRRWLSADGRAIVAGVVRRLGPFQEFPEFGDTLAIGGPPRGNRSSIRSCAGRSER